MGSTRIGTRWLGTLIVAAAVMTACSDSSTAPTSVANKLSDVASFELGLGTGGINNNNTPVAGQFKVCKTGDEPGAFVFSAVADPGGFGPAHAVAAGHSITNGTCEVVAEDNGGNGKGSQVTLQETPSPDLTGTTCSFQSFPLGGPPGAITPCTYDNAGTVASRTFFLNSFHAYVITFNNVAPVVTGCTYTKGWYRNHGDDTYPLGADTRNQAQAQAIFDATPGKPGGVTWNGGNNTLNLYQQTLAAILNGGLTSGIPAVVNAINASIGAENGAGLVINYTSNQTALIDVLSNFNEGKYAGFPHC